MPFGVVFVCCLVLCLGLVWCFFCAPFGAGAFICAPFGAVSVRRLMFFCAPFDVFLCSV